MQSATRLKHVKHWTKLWPGFVVEECASEKDVSTTWTGYDDFAADFRSVAACGGAMARRIALTGFSSARG
jgi:hypothetical protein